MILTGNEIKNEISKGNISISDFDEKQLNPNSYNLRLHSKHLTIQKYRKFCLTRCSALCAVNRADTTIKIRTN